jgi:hypothetical protein
VADAVNDKAGTLDVTNAASTINLGSGATLAFADSNLVDWTGGALNITGNFLSGVSIKFDSSGGLTGDQLDLITLNGGGAGTFSLVGGFLVQSGGGNTFADWIATYPGVGGQTGVGDDADGDGSDNGVENFLGTDPSASSSGLVAGAVGVNTFTFTHPQNATPASDLTAAYQWSKDLATFNAGGVTDGVNTKVDFTTQLDTPVAGTTTVTATVTGTATSKLFVNIKVTQP